MGKQAALAGVRRASAPGATVIIADVGRPRGTLQWLLYTIAGWADGVENTAPHRDRRFEQTLRDEFHDIRSVAAWRTMFGTLEVFACTP